MVEERRIVENFNENMAVLRLQIASINNLEVNDFAGFEECCHSIYQIYMEFGEEKGTAFEYMKAHLAGDEKLQNLVQFYVKNLEETGQILLIENVIYFNPISSNSVNLETKWFFFKGFSDFKAKFLIAPVEDIEKFPSIAYQGDLDEDNIIPAIHSPFIDKMEDDDYEQPYPGINPEMLVFNLDNFVKTLQKVFEGRIKITDPALRKIVLKALKNFEDFNLSQHQDLYANSYDQILVGTELGPFPHYLAEGEHFESALDQEIAVFTDVNRRNAIFDYVYAQIFVDFYKNFFAEVKALNADIKNTETLVAEVVSDHLDYLITIIEQGGFSMDLLRYVLPVNKHKILRIDNLDRDLNRSESIQLFKEIFEKMTS